MNLDPTTVLLVRWGGEWIGWTRGLYSGCVEARLG